MEYIVKLFRNQFAEVKLSSINSTYSVSCINKETGSRIIRNNIKDYELAIKEFMYYVYKIETLEIAEIESILVEE